MASFKSELQRLVKQDVKIKEPLSRYTTWRIGGPADYLVDVSSLDELIKVFKICKKRRVPLVVLGKGSNILISDKGFRGVIVRLKGDFSRIIIYKDKIIVGAGFGLQRLLGFTVSKGLGGLEGLIGIPSSIGGALVTNAGGRWGNIGDVVEKVKILKNGHKIITRSKREMQFSYRESNVGDSEIICEAILNFKKIDKRILTSKIKKYLDIKKNTQPLSSLSCGCVFRNPKRMNAGELISSAGMRGMRIGRARISTKHPNFILNEGNARASDIWSLIKKTKKEVKKMSGVNLELEIKTIGKFD